MRKHFYDQFLTLVRLLFFFNWVLIWSRQKSKFYPPYNSIGHKLMPVWSNKSLLQFVVPRKPGFELWIRTPREELITSLLSTPCLERVWRNILLLTVGMNFISGWRLSGSTFMIWVSKQAVLAVCLLNGALCNIKGIFEQFELELPHKPLFARMKRSMFSGIILGGGLSR